jgi:hypothetical protein
MNGNMLYFHNKKNYISLKLIGGGIGGYPDIIIDAKSITEELRSVFKKYMEYGLVDDQYIDKKMDITMRTMGKVFNIPITFSMCTGKDTPPDACKVYEETTGPCIFFGNTSNCQICLILERRDADTLYLTHLYGNMECFVINKKYEKTAGWMIMCTLINLCEIIGIKKITLTDIAEKGDGLLLVNNIFRGEPTYYAKFGFVSNVSFSTIERLLMQLINIYFENEEHNLIQFGKDIADNMDKIRDTIVDADNDMEIITSSINGIYYELMQMHPDKIFLDILQDPTIETLTTLMPSSNIIALKSVILYLNEKGKHPTMRDLHKKIYNEDYMDGFMYTIFIPNSILIHQFFINIFRTMILMHQDMIYLTKSKK